MKKQLLTLLASLALLVCSLAPAFAATKNVNLLFLQTSKTAKVVQKGKNDFLIMMNTPDKYVSYFSDRPSRITGLVSTSEFAKFWNHDSKSNFATTPPNAAIESVKLVNGKEHRVEIFASLSNPHYNAKDRTMSYELTPMNKNKTKLAKMDLGYTVIFFDDFMVHWNPDNP